MYVKYSCDKFMIMSEIVLSYIVKWKAQATYSNIIINEI